ncbi:hypothetical protein BN903_56 [Halorubrum sp. AJ67]|nr:hypothetical protein BN903_56 [Halorubrum sp. AJ67]
MLVILIPVESVWSDTVHAAKLTYAVRPSLEQHDCGQTHRTDVDSGSDNPTQLVTFETANDE